jgi:hypothetical protein
MAAPLRCLAAAVSVGALLGGCGLIERDQPIPSRAPAPPDAIAEGAAPSRERVQQYLDAMRTKDVRKARTQLCPVLHPGFDQAATGPNGDFARHFTVPTARIVDVRARGGKQEVTATLTVSTGGRRVVRSLKFTVARSDSGWCIDGESPVAAPRPTPSGTRVASPAP